MRVTFLIYDMLSSDSDHFPTLYFYSCSTDGRIHSTVDLIALPKVTQKNDVGDITDNLLPKVTFT